MVDYKTFTQYPEQTLEDFKAFYSSKFSSVFDWFYPNRAKDLVLYATRKDNDFHSFEMVPCSTERYYFSVAIFFHVLIPQVILRVAGGESFKLFIKSSAWPRFSAGMGGPVSAEQWLYESDLYDGDGIFPSQPESEYYNALLDIIHPFFQSELIHFFNGTECSADKDSYIALCEMVREKTNTILEELAIATRNAKKNFEQGIHPVSYLTGDEVRLYYS